MVGLVVIVSLVFYFLYEIGFSGLMWESHNIFMRKFVDHIPSGQLFRNKLLQYLLLSWHLECVYTHAHTRTHACMYTWNILCHKIYKVQIIQLNRQAVLKDIFCWRHISELYFSKIRQINTRFPLCTFCLLKEVNFALSYFQYYFYEYGFDELRRRPRHVCPYAVVSFTYEDDLQPPKFVPSSR